MLPRTLSPEKRTRYSRHILIPEIGEEGQLKLLDSKILLIGAGGLGSPASLYLAAAGIGTLGIVDADIVDETNLQRQIAHSLDTLGTPKVDSAKRAIEALNPDVNVVTYRERLTSENIDRILDDGWDMIVDGADNFPTRYLVNDASVWRGIPVVHGSIYRFEGQVTVFKPHDGPCYRCLFPEPPPLELAPSCSEGGVLGVLPGIVGTLQTNEAIKLALDIGEPLVGRLLLLDALATEFNEVKIERRDRMPRLRRPPDDHRVHRLRGVLREMSVVRVPPVLRQEAGGAREVEASGGDRARAARGSDARAPALGARVYGEGEIHSFVNVYVDGEDIRTRDGVETPVRDGSTVISCRRWPAAVPLARLLDLIGNTPLVELPRLSPPGVRSTRSSRARTRPARSRTASRSRWSRRPTCSPARSCSSRRAATPASRSRSSRS